MSAIKEKVALVTGGASGIGLSFVKALLNEGAKAVAIADVNEGGGRKIVEELQSKFGAKRVAFYKLDVSNKKEFKDVLDKIIKDHKNLDIVINNAGILNENDWEKMVSINFNGVINGTLLALEEYLPKYKSGEEGVIVNTASLAGVAILPGAPIYTAIKHGVVGLCRSFGIDYYYKKSQVRVLAVLPGYTQTNIFNEDDKTIKDYEFVRDLLANIKIQNADHLGKELISIINKGTNGSLWAVDQEEPARQVQFPQLKEMFVEK